MECTLYIPIYNGEEYLTNTFASLNTAPACISDIVFLNDGSTDGTLSRITAYTREHPEAVLLSYGENRGKGAALTSAVHDIRDETRYIAFTDVEIPYGLAAIKDACHYLDTHSDVDIVIGDRTQASPTRTQYTPYRYMANRMLRLLLPRAIRHIHDTQCGVKVMRADVAKKLFAHVKTKRWLFDIELLLTAVHTHMGIYEMPVSIRPACIRTDGGVSVLRHGYKILKDIVTIYWYEARGWYKT